MEKARKAKFLDAKKPGEKPGWKKFALIVPRDLIARLTGSPGFGLVYP